MLTTSKPGARPAPLAIEVAGISKRYRIGELVNYYPTIRETITNRSRAVVARFRDRLSGRRPRLPDFAWALADVTFDIAPGEAVGIIGRNGAGKSTLLKILTRITRPTRGRARLRGRIGSLLEVGAGFHPELTGRENIFLNGAILGMSRSEIRDRFDEIVDFAGVGRYLDTAYKHYSSGMGLRLAFAVAAHFEPEVLLIDEILAVGDRDFQRKCFHKVGNAKREGRTLLLVSHDLSAVQELASRVLLLEQGRLVADGPCATVVAEYLRRLSPPGRTFHRSPPPTKSHIRTVSITSLDANGCQEHDRPLSVELGLSTPIAIERTTCALQIINDFEQPVLESTGQLGSLEAGAHVIVCRIPALFLSEGRYALRISLLASSQPEPVDEVEGVCAFEIALPAGTTPSRSGATILAPAAWSITSHHSNAHAPAAHSG